MIVVGWDGADWRFLDPLVDAGKLPALAALRARGRSWNLETYQPIASPLIWTTLATGRTPVDHGVADFQETDPKTRLKVPVSSRSRRVPAIWNAASARGISTGVVGWWATWPAEKIKGFLVSDRAAPMLFDPSSVPSSALTYPESIADGVKIVARREGTPGYEEVARYLHVTRAEFDTAVAARQDLLHPITGLQKILGSTRVYARTALDLYDREKPELLMVYLEGTDEIGHLLARYHPPKLAGASDEDFRKYSDGATAFFVEADRILGEFARRAEADGATLVLVSDHGFKWGENRPANSSIQSDLAYRWHENPGILAAAGPAIVPSKKRGKATVFDVVPTLSRLLGLPADPKFEGKPVTGLDPKRIRPPAPAVSWASSFPVERLVVRETEADRKSADEFTKKLVSLGYLTGSEATAVDARPPDRAGTETAGALQNIGTFLRFRGNVQESAVWYRKALEVDPKLTSTWMNLSVALLTLQKLDESDDALIQAVKNGYAEGENTIYKRATLYLQSGQQPHLSTLFKKVVAAFPASDRFRSSLGKVLFENRDCAGADAIFKDLVTKKPNDPDTLNLNALSSWCLGKAAEAKALFQRSLALNANQPVIKQGLAQIEQGGAFPR